jgi:polyhydroxyalkanoate synthesis regulator phasin
MCGDRRAVSEGNPGNTHSVGKPVWRQVFDAVDRRVAGPVEAGTRTDAFGDLLALSWRFSRRMQREVERRTRRALHLANLPTATDVRRLSEQVAALQRELRELQDRRP